MKRLLFLCVLAFSFVSVYAINADLQVYYDFGSQGTACANQRSHRVTTTVELLHPDAWGMTFFFFDMDYSINRSNDNPQDPKNMPFGTYWEISRGFNFWQNSKAKDLSVHLEYNGGLGVFGGKVVTGGYGINHAVLVGLDYFLHTPDYKNTFTLELLFKYIADEYNMWQFKKEGQWVHQSGNVVPLQFTFVWNCSDFCTAPGLEFSGFLDIWGQKQSVLDRKTNTYTDPTKQSFVFISEPELWYSVGQWFHCPNLCIGTEIEFSYNFTGKGFMCNPCLGLKWKFL